MEYYRRKREETKQDVIDFLQSGDLVLKQLEVLTQRGVSYLRKIMHDLESDGKVQIIEVWTGGAIAHKYTIKKVKKETNYNKLLTTKW